VHAWLYQPYVCFTSKSTTLLNLVNSKVLTMVYNTQTELLGFWTLFIIQYSKKLENTMFQKLDLFLSSGERETPTLLGPLERANINHWTVNKVQKPSNSEY
jgi:hypothetical protein